MSQRAQPSLGRRFSGPSLTCTCRYSCRQGTANPCLQLHPLPSRPFPPLTHLLRHPRSSLQHLPRSFSWAPLAVILVKPAHCSYFRIASRAVSSFLAPFAFEAFIVLSLPPSISLPIASEDHPCRPISAMNEPRKAAVARVEGLESLSNFSSWQFVISAGPFYFLIIIR